MFLNGWLIQACTDSTVPFWHQQQHFDLLAASLYFHIAGRCLKEGKSAYRNVTRFKIIDCIWHFASEIIFQAVLPVGANTGWSVISLWRRLWHLKWDTAKTQTRNKQCAWWFMVASFQHCICVFAFVFWRLLWVLKTIWLFDMNFRLLPFTSLSSVWRGYIG